MSTLPPPPGLPDRRFPEQRPAATSITIHGGFWRGAIGAITGLVAVAFVFLAGLVIGIGGGAAAVSGTIPVQTTTVREGFGSTVAILPIEGGIDETTAAFVDMSVRYILEDGGFDAVVLRVDSGGGGVTASDQIWHSIGKLKAAGMPVVASYGGMAASGGYYVSCSADEIIAEPTCVTGSIGVIAQVFTMEGLADKVGIRPITIIASGSPEKATGNDTFRSWDEKDRAVLQGLLDTSHDTFVQRVFDGRKATLSTIDSVRAVATGEVFNAERAMQQGLVDRIGYLDDAIASAETRAGMAPGSAAIVRFEPPIALFGGLFGASKSSPAMRTASDLRALASELSTPRLMYRVNF